MIENTITPSVLKIRQRLNCVFPLLMLALSFGLASSAIAADLTVLVREDGEKDEYVNGASVTIITEKGETEKQGTITNGEYTASNLYDGVSYTVRVNYKGETKTQSFSFSGGDETVTFTFR